MAAASACGIARRHQEARLAIDDDLGNAADGGRDDRLAAGHRVEQRGAQPFGDRAHHEDVERLVQRQDVGPKPGQDDVLLEMVVPDLLLERGLQLSFAGDDEARVGLLRQEPRGRVDQVPLALVRHQRRDVADERGVVRQPQLLVQLGRRRRRHPRRGRCLRGR